MDVYFWNITTSPHCCLHCDDTVYKIDTIVDVTEMDDVCNTTETTFCRISPGRRMFHSR